MVGNLGTNNGGAMRFFVTLAVVGALGCEGLDVETGKQERTPETSRGVGDAGAVEQATQAFISIPGIPITLVGPQDGAVYACQGFEPEPWRVRYTTALSWDCFELSCWDNSTIKQLRRLGPGIDNEINEVWTGAWCYSNEFSGEFWQGKRTGVPPGTRRTGVWWDNDISSLATFMD